MSYVITAKVIPMCRYLAYCTYYCSDQQSDCCSKEHCTEWPAMSCWIIMGFRIPTNVVVGVHPLLITLHRIGADETPHNSVIIARIVVVQTRQCILVLPGVAFIRAHATRTVTLVAIGVVELVAQKMG